MKAFTENWGIKRIPHYVAQGDCTLRWKPWGKIEGSSLTPLNDEPLTLFLLEKKKAEVHPKRKHIGLGYRREYINATNAVSSDSEDTAL